jgi:hypothetical protein
LDISLGEICQKKLYTEIFRIGCPHCHSTTYPRAGKKTAGNIITGAASADASLSAIIKWRTGDAFPGSPQWSKSWYGELASGRKGTHDGDRREQLLTEA